eukprot:gene17924-21381_t
MPLSEISGLFGILRAQSGDDFLLYGGNVSSDGKHYIPIIWTYNVQSNDIIQKSFINKEFIQFNFSWDAQIAPYDGVNNVVYLNAERATATQINSVLLKFDFDQQTEDIIVLPTPQGVFVTSSYDPFTHMVYMGGQNDLVDGQLVIVTYDSLTGDMTKRSITFDIGKCYFDTSMYLYNSKYFVGLSPVTGDCSAFIIEVDMIGNSSKILATIPSINSYAINSLLPFVLDNQNGYLFSITCSPDGQLLEMCSVNLNTYEVDQYTIPTTNLPANDDSIEWLMTIS